MKNLWAKWKTLLESPYAPWYPWAFLGAMTAVFFLGFGMTWLGPLGYQVMLLAVVGAWACNLVHCLRDLKNRFVFLIFELTFFIFLMVRPVIDMLNGQEWYPAVAGATFFALFAILLTQIFLRLGLFAGEYWRWRAHPRPVRYPIAKREKGFAAKDLRFVSLCFYGITMAVYLVCQGEKLMYMRGRSYDEYYLFQSQLPFYIHTLASMSTYGLCLYLATMPKKAWAFGALAVYVLAEVPSLLIGIRVSIVLNALFALVYYLLRDALGDGEQWLGKWEKRLVAVAIPVGLVALGLINYLRAGSQVAFNPFALVVDFFYKQGVSYHVLCMGFAAIPLLPGVIAKNYTFGPFLDYLLHGTVAQKLFGAASLGSGNSEFRAIYGYSFAHSMSYVAHPTYLEGNGWGSSYLLEAYADFGYLGIVLISLAFGLLFANALSLSRKGTLLRTCVLVALTSLFFVPRAEATGWLSFLCTLQFWLAVLACYVGAWLWAKLRVAWNKKKTA